MTLRQIRNLGQKILRAIDTRTLAADVLDFASAIALHIDGRRAPAVTAGRWDVDDLARLRKLVAIELRYLDGLAVDYPAPLSREVIDLLEARIIARARGSFDIFAEYCFADETGTPIVQAPMHRRWTTLREQHRKLLIVAHNEAAKSQQNAIYYPVFALGKRPNLRIAILCNTNARAADILRTISDLIANNPQVRAVFPHLLPSEPWSSTQIQVARSASMKEPSVSAFGVRGSLLGQRCDLVIADDLLDDVNTATLALQESTIAWWRSTVETRLTKSAQVILIGTPWTPTDLLAVLEKDGVYYTAKFPIIDPLTGKSTWPSQWDEERIDERRRSLKELEFARAMLLNPRSDEISAFKQAQIEAAIAAGAEFPVVTCLEDLPGGLPVGAAIYVGVDLAATSTAKKRRDNSCVATIAVTVDGMHTLLALDSGRWAPDVIRKKIEEQDTRWNPKIIAVESNGMQKLFVDELKRSGIRATEFVTSNANKHDASVGVESQAILFANGNYRVPRHVAESAPGRALVHGWLFYSKTSHMADEVSAAWIAYAAARSDKRAARMTTVEVGLRIVDGTGEGTSRRTFSDEAARDAYYAEQAGRERSFHERITDVREPENEEDAREARRNALHLGRMAS